MYKLNFANIKLEFSNRYLLVPVVLIVFFLLFFLVYDDIKDRTVNEFNNEQLILAQTAAQGITSFFNDYQADLTFLSKINSIIHFNDDGKALMASFCANHKNLISGFTRVDANGIILYTYPINQSVIGNDISYQKHVNQIIATHKPVLSDVFMSVQGYLAIALHVPIFNGKKYAGSLAMLIPIDKLGERYLGKIKIRGTGNVWLLSENGIEIFCPINGHEGKSYLEITRKNPSAYKLLETIKKDNYGAGNSIEQEVIVHGKPQFIQKYVTFYRAPLGNTYWTILISYQEEDIYIALTRLRNRLILIFLLIFITISYYFYSLSKVRTVLKEEAKRKKAEKTLRESEEKFRTIFNESPIGVEVYRADGTQITANKASLKMFGISGPSEVQNFNLFDGAGLNDDKIEKLHKGVSVSYQALIDFEKVKELNQYKTSKTGKAFFDYIITPLLNSENKSIDGYLVQIQDITERKRDETEILMLAQSLKSVNECVSITDLENNILFVNEAFIKTYGYHFDELIGKNIRFLRSKNNTTDFLNEILPTTLQGGWKGELLNIRKDGSEFPVYLSTTSIKDKYGNLLGLIGVASDITIRKQNETELIKAKERAEESDRLKSAFLANMSHEIRTPMNGILGFAELLKKPGLSGSAQQKYIDIIEQSGTRMLNIINDIVDISKIEAGQMDVFVKETNVNHQIEFIYTFFRPQAEQKKVLFLKNPALSDHQSIIYTDREKLYAILTNLVKNALKFTSTGLIEFGYRVKPVVNFNSVSGMKELEFFVRDTGIGIATDRQVAIFERFIQADIADKQAYQGAGLGLAISKAYVEMLGGRIWVESDEGKGSVFYFTLPYATEVTSTPGLKVKSDQAAETNHITGLKVLIAEDDYESDLFISLAINTISREVLHARTGTEAVEISLVHPDIDLILMDLKMPELNGFEATRKIRGFNKDVVIIAQTAYALAGDREKALQAGCNDYISKPVKIDALIALIQKHINSSSV
jgi:PAS domain S-box-containing protein